MRLRSFAVIGLVACGSFAAGVAVEKQAAGKDLDSHIYAEGDARLTSGAWGKLRIYTEEATPTYGTSSMLTAELEILPGQELHPPHEHADEEFQYIVSGGGTWFLNGKQFPIKPGDLMYSKPWDSHGVRNTGTEPLRFFVVKWNSKGVQLTAQPGK